MALDQIPVNSDERRPPSGGVAPALEMVGLGHRFGAMQAVSGVTLSLARGERHAVLGPNGAGKTTLFNLLTGDILASEGRVLMGGVDITRQKPPQRIHAGLRRTYQKSLLFTTMSVADNLFLALQGVSGRPLRLWPGAAEAALYHQARAIADRVHLSAAFDAAVGDLSHGQQRQLEIGMALVGQPSVILFDEPAAGLSPAERADLVALIEALPRDLTIAMVEHDLDIALRLCDRVTIMQNGRVVASGSPAQITADPAVQQIYLGGQHG